MRILALRLTTLANRANASAINDLSSLAHSSALAPLVHLRCIFVMLRIGVSREPAALKLILQGELIEPWVSELKAVWDAEINGGNCQRCIVDLEDVTRVDESGKCMLAAMKSKGAELLAKGVSMKHLIKCLRKRDVQ